jgi:hypothetical protein
LTCRSTLTARALIEVEKIEGYKDFEKMWNELQLLELNAEQRIDPKNFLSVDEGDEDTNQLLIFFLSQFSYTLFIHGIITMRKKGSEMLSIR